MTAYLIGKGKSIDSLTAEDFDSTSTVWCLNQAADVIAKILPHNRIICVQNDPWINYAPPKDVKWHCGMKVVTKGRKAIHYDPLKLTGNEKSPTCLCALELIKRAGEKSIVMYGFDSFFDDSVDYSKQIKRKADGIAPFNGYNFEMEVFAKKNGISLEWRMGKISVSEKKRNRRCILGVAVGDQYRKQCKIMFDSFLEYNDGWDAICYSDRNCNGMEVHDLNLILPRQFQKYTNFDKCEIGRFVAMRNLLQVYDEVLYCDNDMFWYAKYDSPNANVVLTPHYVKDSCNNKSMIVQCGAPNIGIMKMRGVQGRNVCGFVIDQVTEYHDRNVHNGKLWLQHLMSYVPWFFEYDIILDKNVSVNTAFWNIKREKRSVSKKDGKYFVDGKPLVSFHFSGSSINELTSGKFGKEAKELADEYLRRLKK